MADRIVLFDLNGTLDTEEGLEFFREQESRVDTTTGILTANGLLVAELFAKDNNIEPDIISRSFVKSKELMLIMLRYDSAERIYVGNMPTDRLAANVAGWKYVDVSDL